MKKFLKWIHRADLLACPFCGTEAAKDEYSFEGVRIAVYECESYGFPVGKQFVIRCAGCMATISRGSEDFAVEAWNRRA